MNKATLIVTGGTRGIGAAISRLAARRGYAICATYQGDDEAARELAADVKSIGSECLLVKGDVSDPFFAERALKQTLEAFGSVSGLVNNAGVTGRIGPFVDTSTDTFRTLLDTNLLGPMLTCRTVIAHWLASGTAGAIVNISSVAATLGAPHEYVGYAATKAGVEALTVGLAKEFGSRAIRVNAVAPGTIYTDIHAAAGEPDRPQRVVTRIPMGRVGEPDEIAGAVLWLLSDEASYASGTVLRVAGGL